MGTFVYALWWLANRQYDTFPHDAIVLSVLLSLDAQTLVRWWLWKHSGR